ncbi:MAG: DUF2220 domain-containing protein [Gammaproteobacteria bacterium]|nr:DUF2220 domain-containing protein [Gammaproteobacteria bacterium]MBU2056960.1 DUF2220 domain-containing protein [Gammaproteobacteria bacterium]MBU2174508.1 DUF2220 domain-containing protein [Gammaproteobacteria bacterium]MBU2248200.1 DUF2220 domain-containing protein [Gammaproteobacteria bacterium]MBU2345205.1 DUF2220 domain-containing protein [Gammaproteobacteria bacterium]
MHYPPLTAQALRYLQQLQQRLKASGSERVNTRTKSVQQVLLWCIEHDLVPGNSLQVPQFTFNLTLLNDIAAVQQRFKQACFQDDTQHKSRMDNAVNHHQELKSIGLKPRQHRVLLKLNTPANTGLGVTAECIDIDWQQLTLSSYDTLLVVENLDCFYQLQRFALELTCQQPLIIYRGDRLYSKGCTALKAAWLKQHKPALYFGDCDAKGLSIALNEGYSAMLLPDLVTLQQQVSPAMLPDKQLKFIPALKAKRITHAFTPYLQVVCEQLKGLRQQNMQGMLLNPISVD